MCTLNTHLWVPISLCFALRSLIFQVIEVFGFSIGCNGEIQQEAQGLGALLDKMEDNDRIKVDNIEI